MVKVVLKHKQQSGHEMLAQEVERVLRFHLDNKLRAALTGLKGREGIFFSQRGFSNRGGRFSIPKRGEFSWEESLKGFHVSKEEVSSCEV